MSNLETGGFSVKCIFSEGSDELFNEEKLEHDLEKLAIYDFSMKY